MRKIVLLLAATLLLSSCLAIESRIAIRADGSGTLSLTYRVSQFVADLGRSSADKSVVPLPVYREDFERGLRGVQGVTLKSFRRSVDEKDITISAELSFDSVDSLDRIAAFRDAPAHLTSSGGRHTFSQLVVKGATGDLSEDTLQMIDTFFDGYAVTLTVEAPSPVQSHSLGALAPDRKQVTYTAPVKDLVASKKDVVFEVSW
jgi:hypothetical protein